MLSRNGEYVCEKCGLVHDESRVAAFIKQGYESKHEPLQRHAEPFIKSPFKVPIPWRKAGRGRRDIDGTLVQHYSKLDIIHRYYIDGLPLKSLRRAYAALLSSCSLIHPQIAPTIKRRSLEMYYTVVLKNKHTKKNHVAIMMACFYVALREIDRSTDLTLNKLIMHVRKLGFNISLSDIFKALFTLRKTLGVILKPRKSDDLLPYAISKIINDDNIKRRLAKNGIDPLLYSKKLYEETVALLQKRQLQKNPLSLIATALYTADKILALKYQWKEVLSQKNLSLLLGVSPFTIRELYYKVFRKYIFSGSEVLEK